MKYRFPRWILYLSASMAMAPVIAIVWQADRPPPSSSISGAILFGLIVCGPLVLAAWGCLYVSRHSIELQAHGVLVTGVVRTKLIPLSAIAYVITVSSARGGTDSWLMDKDGAILAKIDGSLVGFQALLANLGERLRPFQALCYRRVAGLWEMQVAGDTKWVPSQGPGFIARAFWRPALILIVGLILILVAAVASIGWQPRP